MVTITPKKELTINCLNLEGIYPRNTERGFGSVPPRFSSSVSSLFVVTNIRDNKSNLSRKGQQNKALKIIRHGQVYLKLYPV